MNRLISLLLLIGVVGSLASCTGYTPGAKAYWDARIKELCEKDGGIVVYERVHLTENEIKSLGVVGGIVLVPPEDRASPSAPYVFRKMQTTINVSGPYVARTQTQLVRRSDGKVLGQSIQYWRSGGDFPTGIGEASSFACPEKIEFSSQIFVF